MMTALHLFLDYIRDMWLCFWSYRLSVLCWVGHISCQLSSVPLWEEDRKTFPLGNFLAIYFLHYFMKPCQLHMYCLAYILYIVWCWFMQLVYICVGRKLTEYNFVPRVYMFCIPVSIFHTQIQIFQVFSNVSLCIRTQSCCCCYCQDVATHCSWVRLA